MLSTLFKTKPVIDDSSKMWIFDTFIWCIAQLDEAYFKQHSTLILPNNSFYPGNSTSIEEMAASIFENTTRYAGMTAWPINMVPLNNFIKTPMPKLFVSTALRGENATIQQQAITRQPTAQDSIKQGNTSISYNLQGEYITAPAEHKIAIAYHGDQLNQPQDFIAYLVQHQASILVSQQAINNPSQTPPGGKDMLPQTIDLVACFMGFGVIFANTAYQFKGGCGSCNKQQLNRHAALPELETVYALALFCVIKGSDTKQIKKQLKSHLCKTFRQAHKDISLYLQQTTHPSHALLKMM